MKNSTIFLLAGALCLFACSEDEPQADPCLSNPPAISAATPTSASCGQANGRLVIAASGGTAPLEYSINGGAYQSSSTFENLAMGSYAISVRDANGCTASLQQSIAESSDMEVMATVTTAAGCGTSNGALTITLTGGTGPFTYSLNGSSFQADPHFTGLAAGNYTPTVRDASNCSASSPARVMSGTSYEAEVRTIIQSNCAISGCHASGTPQPDFTNLSTIQARAADIKTRTQNGSMPPPGSGVSLSQDQVAAIACWVDDGALDN
ncbi:SprB repeat-containing protein [Cesiribacter andamanensis]|uniref:SprB repeat-containing protein n=1 Tax=Cesiribacter andamanensis AMV16 TaxID=1279009 RepID=M7MZP4_9BACT|nr:SprB repeat-containing protein [Cesiribacter andamanensis]EMR01898.1 hypothetical protein ADICEAN_02967 [Cesiribacter andamanensis AMV16]